MLNQYCLYDDILQDSQQLQVGVGGIFSFPSNNLSYTYGGSCIQNHQLLRATTISPFDSPPPTTTSLSKSPNILPLKHGGGPHIKVSSTGNHHLWSWGGDLSHDESMINNSSSSSSKRMMIINGGSSSRILMDNNLGSSSIKMMKTNKKKIKGNRKKVTEPRFCFKTLSDVDVLDDGYKWRKYGQKVVKNTQHPRSYYRCTQVKCRVKKRIERLAEDPRMVITTYEGRHIHSPSHDHDNQDEYSPSSSHLNTFFCM